MANRFTTLAQTRYYELPIDAYQQALGVSENKTASDVNDLASNVQFIRNMPAVGGPDAIRLQQLHDQIDQGINSISKRDLSAADTLNDLRTMITDKDLNNTATGIYQNVLGFRKKLDAINEYKKKYGNGVNTARLENSIGSYLKSKDASSFQAGYFDNLQDPSEFIDIEGEVAKLAKDFKANKYTMEQSNGTWIKKTSQSGLSENELYKKAYEYAANNPKYASQFQENTFFNAINAGQGDVNKGYQSIAGNYQQDIQGQIDNLAQQRDSDRVPHANKQQIQDQINNLSQQKKQVDQAISNGDFQAIASYKTKQDIIAGGSKPFAWNDTEQGLKADPYGLEGYKEALKFKFWTQKQKSLDQMLPITPFNVFEGLSDQQAKQSADDKVTSIFGSPVTISKDGTKIELNSSEAKAARFNRYLQESKDLQTKMKQEPGIGNFLFGNHTELNKADDLLKQKYGINSDLSIRDMPEDLTNVKSKLNDLALSNPQLKQYTSKGDYVSALKLYRDALTNNEKMMDGYVLNKSTGFDQGKLQDLMAGLSSQPVKILTPDGKGIQKVNNINEALQSIGAINAKTKWSDVQNMIFSPKNQIVWRKDGMISLQVATPTGMQKLIITPPKQMLDQFQGLIDASSSTKQGIVDYMGGKYISSPKVINGKIQQVMYQPVTAPEQLPVNHNLNDTKVYHILSNTIGAAATQKALNELAKLSGTAESNTYLFDTKGNIVDEAQAQGSNGQFIGITVHNNGAHKMINISKLATDANGSGLNLDRMFDYKFIQSAQPGGLLSGFRATKKESIKNTSPYSYDNSDQTNFTSSDDDEE